MDLDDEFGDLYTDVLAPPSSSISTFPSSTPIKPFPLSSSPNFDFENDDEEILYGSTDPNFSSPSQTLLPKPSPDSIPAPEPDSTNKNPESDRSFDQEQSKISKPLLPAENEATQTLEPIENSRAIDVDIDVNGDHGENTPNKMEEKEEVDVFGSEAIPGISTGSFLGFSSVENGLVKNDDSGDDWEESDSEDDLQIVLNDSVDPLGVGLHMGIERNEEVGSDDEDGEDLVIVADGDPVGEVQEWGEDSTMLPGADGERKEMGDASKASGGAMMGMPRIGYSNHGYHHYSQFKYVRPGASSLSGGAMNSAGVGPGQVRPFATMGSIAGRGRGDWRAPMQKGFHSGFGIPVWGNNSAVRAFGNGPEFTLPPHKTVFDFDIDTFEEKPWRYPGVDTSDFFNFALDEDTWKDYCKQLEQLRLEATMQSKIRVYESGRSEQDYDPDLPPELMAAAGVHDASVENPHLEKTDGRADLGGHGRETARIRPPIPMGRAIQVEGGYGERLPSIDTRPPRFRDSDSVIEIVLQGSVDDDSMTSNDALERAENVDEGEDIKGGGHIVEDGKQGDTEYFERFPPPYNDRKREVAGRRAPFPGLGPGNSHEGDGILPFPSEAPLQYHANSKNRGTMYPGGLLGTPHGGRWSQGAGRERYPQMGGEHVNDTILNPSAIANRSDSHQNEKLGDSLEGKQTSEASFPIEDEDGREQSIERKNDLHNEHILTDSIEVEGEETASDLKIPTETAADSSSSHSAKKLKLSSRIEQIPAIDDVDDDSKPAIHDLGNDLRAQSDNNSNAKSGNSREYQKRREGGEEEVAHDGRSRRIGDGKKRHEEEPVSFRKKDDYGRDGRQEIERNRMAVKGREDLYHPYPHRDWDGNSVHQARIKNEEKIRERDGSVGVWHRREDTTGRRDKDDDSRRRERIEETVPKHRSKVHEIDRNEKDWRGRHDKDSTRQRERDDLLIGRYGNLEDPHIKRREEELQRRERVEKEEALHGFRAREDASRRKRERDDGLDVRRREDQVRVRDKPDDHHSLRQRDARWPQREKEDRQKLKPSHENAQSNREREEVRGVLRGSKGLEEKTWHANARAKDDSKGLGSDRDRDRDRGRDKDRDRDRDRSRDRDRDQIKDKKRHGEHGKIRDRIEEESLSEHRAREDSYTRENQNVNEERNPRHERSNAQNESQQIYKERYKESARSKESEVVDPNAPASGKRKLEGSASRRNEKVSTRGSIEQETSNALTMENFDSRDNSHSKSTSSVAVSKKAHHHHHHSQHETLVQRHSSKKHGDDVPSEDDHLESSRRGRSKLERWTSQKDRDSKSNAQSSSKVDKENEKNNSSRAPLVIEPKDLGKKGDSQIMDVDENTADADPKDEDAVNISDTRLADADRNEDRHLDTVAKLKKRSERFKLPMPSEDVTVSKKVESDVLYPAQSEAVADAEVKHERPARKRRWVSN